MVSQSVTAVSPSITAQLIEMPFGLRTWLFSRNQLLLFLVSVFAHRRNTGVSCCVKTLRWSRYTSMKSFHWSISTDHDECEGVFLHTRCSQHLHTGRGQSVCWPVTVRKNLRTASLRLWAISSVSLCSLKSDLDRDQNLGFGFCSVFTENHGFGFKTDSSLLFIWDTSSCAYSSVIVRHIF